MRDTRSSRSVSGPVAVLAAMTAVVVIACSGGGQTTAAGVIDAGAGAAASAAPAGADASAGGGGAPVDTPNANGSSAGGTGSGAGAAADGKVVADVCGLLSADDLKSVLGIDFPAGTAKDVSGTTATCDWEVKAGTSDALVSLMVEAFDQGQWDIAKKLKGSRTVPGLGDDAVFTFLDVLDVKKGDRDFTIEIVMVPAASASTLDDQKVQLARLVLGRLQ